MRGSSNDRLNREPIDEEPLTDDEGGLRAPPDLHGWRKAWWWFDFIILVKLARLRFIGILFVIGLIITQWDTLVAYYDRWTRPAEAAGAVSSDIEYFCPMHPSVIRDTNKEKCPICFMPLSKRKKGDGKAEALPAGVVNRVQLTPYRVVLAGVQTWPVDYYPLTKEIAAVGFVEFNERGQSTVSARVAGRIDKLYTNETGKMVEAGDELASLYSPDLLVTVENLINAQRDDNQDLLKGARTRLELWGIDGDQIDEILAAGKANTHLKIRSPISGHVINKYVREGQYVEEGMPLYEVADLSTVWIQAQVYEDDMAFLPIGTDQASHPALANGLEVTATTRAYPNEEFHGKLAFIYPHVDQDTRTVTVRFEVDNPHPHKLRPGSTANVTLRVHPDQLPMFARDKPRDKHNSMGEEMLSEGKILAVPESAVIDTGSQRIVYRETLPGTFEGVEVKLGPRMAGPQGETLYPVLNGLAQGDLVVTSGSFLVDAETRLNPAVGSIYFGGSGGSQAKQASATVVRPTTPEDPDAMVEAALAKLSLDDRKLAEAQKFCPVLPDSRLGGMGTPVKLMVDGQPVFVCCSGCTKKALANPKETLAAVEQLKSGEPSVHDSHDDEIDIENDGEDPDIRAALEELSPADRELARSQRFCAVLNINRLGSMGPPVKVMIDGEPVFLCCAGCEDRALANPQKTLASVKRLKEVNAPRKQD